MALSWAEPYFGLSERDVRRTPHRQSVARGAASLTDARPIRLSVQPPSIHALGVMELAASRIDEILQPLLNLPVNWDSYGGRPLSRESAAYAHGLVLPLIAQGVSGPTFVPMSDGGVSLEWHHPSAEFVIHVPSAPEAEAPTVYFADESGEWEAPLAEAQSRASDALARFIEG